MWIQDLFRRQKNRHAAARIYLDHAAATPVHPSVLKAMLPYFNEKYGNPSAIHKEGMEGRNAIEQARRTLARILHVRESGVIFTGSGTEANNLALYGLIKVRSSSGSLHEGTAIITTALEHPSISAVVDDLREKEVTVHRVRVDGEGRIDSAHLQELLSPEIALVTFAYVNSEIGVIEDVKRITRMVRHYNHEHGTNILTHLDAAQAPLWLPVEMDMLGVDLMSLDAGKCYGPKGVGVLAFRHGVELRGVTLGGGQERGLRAGTENTPLVVGSAEAIKRAAEGHQSRSEAVASLRDHMIERLLHEITDCVLNGSREHRVANNVNVSILGIDSEFAVVTLDTCGIAASTKSACGGADSGGSKVVEEIAPGSGRAASTIRFTLGEETTKAEVDRAVEILKAHATKMRSFSEDTGTQKY